MQNSIEMLRKLIDDGYIKSAAAAARAMGFSTSLLSQLISGTYPGDSGKYYDKVTNYVKIVLERVKESTPEVSYIPELSNTVVINKICKLVHVQRMLGVIIGSAGRGKSVALAHYARNNSGVIYIPANASTSAKALLKRIHSELGMNAQGALDDLLHDITGKLSNTGKLLIIDQAESVPEKGVDLIRTLHDDTGIGVVLAGSQKLLDIILGTGYVNEQIFTRVGVKIELKPLSDPDLQLIIQSIIPDAQITPVWASLTRRNGRVARILATEVRRLMNNTNLNISDDLVRKASKQLIGGGFVTEEG